MVEVSHSISDTDPMYIAGSISKFRKANKNTQYTNPKKPEEDFFEKCGMKLALTICLFRII